MKSLKLICAFALAVLFSVNVNAQKTALANAEIPAEITNYITQNFKEHRIIKAIKEVNVNMVEYEVTLNKKVKLEFDETLKIKEIKAKKGISLNLIPLPVANYVKSHFPDLKIIEWELNKNGQGIELNNKTEIQFDQNGNFIKIENN